MKYYKERSNIKNGADTKEVGLTYQGEIVVGKFVDRERPTWLDAMNEHFTKVLGDRDVYQHMVQEAHRMAKTEIRVGGPGRPGRHPVRRSIIGKAAAIYGGKHATLIQAFGPEARGSACSAQVIIVRRADRLPLRRSSPTSWC